MISTGATAALTSSTFSWRELSNLNACPWRVPHTPHFGKVVIPISQNPLFPLHSSSPAAHCRCNACTRSAQLLMSLLITLSVELIASPAVLGIPGAAECSGKRCSLAMFDSCAHYSLARVSLGTTVLESGKTAESSKRKRPLKDQRSADSRVFASAAAPSASFLTE